MRGHRRAAIARRVPAPVLAALLLVACGPPVGYQPPVWPAAAPPPPPYATPLSGPDLRGTWRGTWAGALVELVLIEQRPAWGPSGLHLGPLSAGTLLDGRRDVHVSGIMTVSTRGRAVSANISGWLAARPIASCWRCRRPPPTASRC